MDKQELTIDAGLCRTYDTSMDADRGFLLDQNQSLFLAPIHRPKLSPRTSIVLEYTHTSSPQHEYTVLVDGRSSTPQDGDVQKKPGLDASCWEISLIKRCPVSPQLGLDFSLLDECVQSPLYTSGESHADTQTLWRDAVMVGNKVAPSLVVSAPGAELSVTRM